jgi:hypothetical protein
LQANGAFDCSFGRSKLSNNQLQSCWSSEGCLLHAAGATDLTVSMPLAEVFSDERSKY